MECFQDNSALVSYVIGRPREGEPVTLIGPLVPNRECGSCTVCCEALTIDVPELKKLPGILCENCKDGGCAIYKTRPNVCRNWYCGWRMMEDMDDDWRPDRCGFVVSMVGREDIPPEYSSPLGFKFDLVGNARSVMWEPFLHRVAALIHYGVPVFFTTPGRPVGYAARKTLLNPGMQAAVASREKTAILGQIISAMEFMASETCEKIEL